MHKKKISKSIHEFLNSNLPENLLPTKNLNRKQKKLIFFKTKRLKNQFKQVEQIFFRKAIISKKENYNIVNLKHFNSFVPLDSYFETKENKTKVLNQKKSKILFSSDQLKMELVKRQIKTSEFKNQLKERKKLSILYGNLSKKQIKKLYFKANKFPGEKKANWLRLLESRLDVVLFKICFFKTIHSARQWILHKKILVNGKIISFPNYILNPGDLIHINHSQTNVIQILEFVKKNIYFKRNRFFLSESYLNRLNSDLQLYILKSSFYRWNNFFSNFCLEKNKACFLPSEIFYHHRWSPLDKEQHKGEAHRKQLQSNIISKANKNNRNKIHKVPNWFLNYYKFRAKIFFELIEHINNFLTKTSLKVFEKSKLLKVLIYLEKNIQSNFLFCTKFKFFFGYIKSQKQTKLIRRISAFKPLHLEVSYKTNKVIFLYSPQKITLNVNLDLDLIAKSFK
jgi:ribosomal protein S4